MSEKMTRDIFFILVILELSCHMFFLTKKKEIELLDNVSSFTPPQLCLCDDKNCHVIVDGIF